MRLRASKDLKCSRQGTDLAFGLRERRTAVFGLTPRFSATQVPAACSDLVDLASRMGVPADYAIAEFIDVGLRNSTRTDRATRVRGDDVELRATRAVPHRYDA